MHIFSQVSAFNFSLPLLQIDFDVAQRIGLKRFEMIGARLAIELDNICTAQTRKIDITLRGENLIKGEQQTSRCIQFKIEPQKSG